MADTTVDLQETPAPRSIIVQPDLSYWEERTIFPDREFELFRGGWACELVLEEPVAIGRWKLVGMSSNPSYTPILDIYSDRTGRKTKNDTTYYYHFQLSAQGK